MCGAIVVAFDVPTAQNALHFAQIVLAEYPTTVIFLGHVVAVAQAVVIAVDIVDINSSFVPLEQLILPILFRHFAIQFAKVQIVVIIFEILFDDVAIRCPIYAIRHAHL